MEHSFESVRNLFSLNVDSFSRTLRERTEGIAGISEVESTESTRAGPGVISRSSSAWMASLQPICKPYFANRNETNVDSQVSRFRFRVFWTIANESLGVRCSHQIDSEDL